MKSLLTKWAFKKQKGKEAPTDLSANEHEKYRKSGLTLGQALCIKEKVVYALGAEKIYRNSNISLNDLAEHITTDRYKISEVINTHFSKNFYSLINHYRVEEAKELLAKDHHLSVKAIMYEVGFNSKNSFYTAFKKNTGLNPNDFRAHTQKDDNKIDVAYA